jgi:hypothetical protein
VLFFVRLREIGSIRAGKCEWGENVNSGESRKQRVGFWNDNELIVGEEGICHMLWDGILNILRIRKRHSTKNMSLIET